MAERRMFSKAIIDSDAFCDMPLSTQALYFHLALQADDDGFVNNPKKIMRMIGASGDDFKLLQVKNFVIVFDSGIVAIVHWRLHNCIKKDRYKPTVYAGEMSQIAVDEKGLYTECIHECTQDVSILEPKWIQNGSKLEPQGSIGKVSIGKVSVVEGSESGNEKNDGGDGEESDSVENSVENSKLSFMNGPLGKGVVLLSDDQISALLDKLGLDAFDFYVDKLASFITKKGAKVGNHYNTILKWAREDSRV